MTETTQPLGKFDYHAPINDADRISQSLVYKLIFTLGIDPKDAQPHHWLNAAMYVTRDLMTENFLRTRRAHESNQARTVYYLSMEFLMGRAFTNTLINQGLYDTFQAAFEKLGLNLTDISEQEPDPGLGNGGLGRLAACFMDSLATLRVPAVGYGIRYQYGMFKQEIIDGVQVEKPDLWLDSDMSWQFSRPDKRIPVYFGGFVHHENGKSIWEHADQITATPYDEIISGYGSEVANPLRLWTAHADGLFDLSDFNRGDYFAAMAKQTSNENIARVLYPNDSTPEGRELRLKQEYFLVSASVQDIVARHLCRFPDIRSLADHVIIHLNDTHPVLAIPELMRILIDKHDLSFDEAWAMCHKIFSYTNHTLMQEALEKWSVHLVGRLLPRHLEIIYQINENFLHSVRSLGYDDEFVSRVSIIEESNDRMVRMAWLAVIASHKVNGVAKIHSDLMKTSIFADFAKLFPDRFTNVTNGVTPRRWIAAANRPLAAFLDQHLGNKDWRTHLDKLTGLNKLAGDTKVQQQFADVKHAAKVRLADYVKRELNIDINPNALFDVQIKRFHDYKRQNLNILHIIYRYNQILKNPNANWQPRVFIFAGKAASAYYEAKQTIRLINDAAYFINHDERIRDLIKVVFIPNYSVSLAQLIIPATDLSEQISLAGKEASGTSNMKFALNGALTIGTLDGANVEMLDYIGAENMFIFGNTVEQVEELYRNGYNPYYYLERNPDLYEAAQQIVSGRFSPTEPQRFNRMMHHSGDPYQMMADFDSYVAAHQRVDELYQQPEKWRRAALINIANMGYFSSDRSIQDYCDNIWYTKPLTDEQLNNPDN